MRNAPCTPHRFADPHYHLESRHCSTTISALWRDGRIVHSLAFFGGEVLAGTDEVAYALALRTSMYLHILDPYLASRHV